MISLVAGVLHPIFEIVGHVLDQMANIV